METNTLFVQTRDSQTGNSYLSTQFTLRSCNKDYRRVTGKYINSNEPPEFDCNKERGKIALLRTFDNPYGHWITEELNNEDKRIGKKPRRFTKIFSPSHYSTPFQMLTQLKRLVEDTIDNGYLWDINNTIMLTEDHIKHYSEQGTHKDFLKVVGTQFIDPYTPISVHPPHAYLESMEKGDKEPNIYGIPGQSTIVTGILGGLHNNTSVEMGFIEKDGVKDTFRRTYDRKYIGFLCAAHTSHSADAGKSRRVCSYTRVRVLSKDIFDSIIDASKSISDKGIWTLYCMGLTCKTNFEGVFNLVMCMDNMLQLYYQSQFEYPSPFKMTSPPTYCIYQNDKVLYISIAPGTLLRSTITNSMIDSHMLYNQKENSIVDHPQLPEYGPESIKYKYSPFFMLAPFTEHDRPPRSLFASGQTTQGIFFPWSPATARVSPLHSSRPLVSTKFMKSIQDDFENETESIWDIFPGEDMLICYMNTSLNYEDSVVVSSKFSDSGGFSTYSECTYRIPDSQKIPEIGEKLCGKKYKWWKNDCTSTCPCKIEQRSDIKTVSTSGRVPSGIVNDILRTEDGSISIKVLSFSQILTGDKVSTMHGQKGVVRIQSQENLPLIVMKDGSSFTADIYMAVGSIVSRQTNGQIYESEMGWRAAKDGERKVVSGVLDTDTEECDYIINPTTGLPIMREMPSNIIEPIRATIGFTRVLNQTQMTRERHHLTHGSEGKYSLGTTPGRASGGGVAVSEMDFHALYSTGLYSCAQELFQRGNMTKIPFCRECQVIFPLHDKNKDHKPIMVNMSSDNAIFDAISFCINSSCNIYKVEHI